MPRLFRLLLMLTLLLVSSCGRVGVVKPTDEIVPVPARSKFQPPPGSPRYLVFVSDFHMGLGRKPDGAWNATEDFRWPEALRAFLDTISRRGEDRVDLVIVGDFLELWQLPADIECQGYDEDHGCTVDEMVRIAEKVVRAHDVEMAALRLFSQRGENRLHIIPGNHDSTLVLARVWETLATALCADSGRVNLVENGIWVSKDGRIVVEHGHQIGSDVNAYKRWPQVIDRAPDGRYYVIRPWGEQFVQKVFNKEEEEYPIIDNLSPETAGARYRMADRGLWRSIRDIARFIAFNLFETSLSQKVRVLGPDDDPFGKPEWDVKIGRDKGHRLFTEALPPEDPFRNAVLDSTNAEAAALREELDALAVNQNQLPDVNVRLLCDMIALRGGPLCKWEDAGQLLESLLVSRESVLRAHLNERWNQYPRIRVFIYGHTHQLESKWDLRLEGNKVVSILNTGAFQRVVDEPRFLRRVEAKARQEGRTITPGEALRALTHDDLPPCYTVVEVPYKNGRPDPVTRRWYMPGPKQAGRMVEVGDPVCD